MELLYWYGWYEYMQLDVFSVIWEYEKLYVQKWGHIMKYKL
jgi:hypothetical protein